MRERPRGVQFGHPCAATGDGQVRGTAAMRYWRQVGAVSVEVAVATYYSARNRRHCGAELAL